MTSDGTGALPTGLRERLDGLLEIVTKVAEPDFLRKPPAVEGDDALSRFTLDFRCMIEDFGRALTGLDQERRELQAANERLLELDKIKGRLINSAAHDLGTPLTPIKMQLQMLKASSALLNAKQKRGLEIVDRDVERRSFLAGDLLDVARLALGTRDIRLEPLNLSPLVHEAKGSFVDAAARANPTVESQLGKDLWVHEDASRLTQVLHNLFSNALKFSRPAARS